MSNIFKHFLNRSLAHIKRFSNEPQHFPESVAEHSFYATYFTSIICHFLKEKGEEVNEAKAIKMALVHDMEESFSGDIIGPFKHYSEELLEAIRKVNQEVIQEVFEDLPKNLSQEFISLWQEELEQKSLESQVVKVADKLSLISKAYEEIKGGNAYFQNTYDKEMEKLEALAYPWWQKIKADLLSK